VSNFKFKFVLAKKYEINSKLCYINHKKMYKKIVYGTKHATRTKGFIFLAKGLLIFWIGFSISVSVCFRFWFWFTDFTHSLAKSLDRIGCDREGIYYVSLPHTNSLILCDFSPLCDFVG